MSEYQAVCEERDALKEECAWLKGSASAEATAENSGLLQSAYALSPVEASIILELYGAHHRFLTYETLNERLPERWVNSRHIKTLKVWAHRIRAKMGADVLDTVWNQGFRLTYAGIAKVDSTLASEPGRAA